jgi:hypothetical protein
VRRSSFGDRMSIPLPRPEIFAAVAPGDHLLIDDGRVRLRVTSLGSDSIDAEVGVGGVISDRKGVNLPGTVLDLSPLTAKDRADLAFGLKLGADWIALSYWRAVDVTHVGFRWRGSDDFLSWRGGRDGTSDHDPNGFRDGGGSAPHGETAGLAAHDLAAAGDR